MVALNMEDCLNKIEELTISEMASYSYSEGSMVKVFVYGLIKGIHEFKTLHDHLEGKPEVQSWLGWQQVPHRTTLSRRFKTLSEQLCGLIAEVYQEFVNSKHIQEEAMSVDSSLMQANGNVWHKKDREAGVLPKCGNIDTEAHWGVNGCGEWTFGYRFHCLVNANAELALPKDVAVYAANIKDASVFTDELARSLSADTQVVLADGSYDEQPCYDVCDAKQISLIAPLEIKPNTPPERIERATLFNDPDVREVFVLRKVSVEPFQGHLKSLFDLDQLPVKGLKNVRSLVLLATFLYNFLAWLNLLLNRPILHLKQTLLALR
jgi:Transposase DDE domain